MRSASSRTPNCCPERAARRAYSLAGLAVEEVGKAGSLATLGGHAGEPERAPLVGRMLEWHQWNQVMGQLTGAVPFGLPYPAAGRSLAARARQGTSAPHWPTPRPMPSAAMPSARQRLGLPPDHVRIPVARQLAGNEGPTDARCVAGGQVHPVCVGAG